LAPPRRLARDARNDRARDITSKTFCRARSAARIPALRKSADEIWVLLTPEIFHFSTLAHKLAPAMRVIARATAPAAAAVAARKKLCTGGF
jgi:hypothetical protein